MVSIYNAYRVLNKSIADLAKNINAITPAEDIRIDSNVVRLEEADFVVTERGKRLSSNLTVAYDLTSYRKNFYLMESGFEEDSILEFLLKPIEELDLTEFNTEGLDYVNNRNNF